MTVGVDDRDIGRVREKEERRAHICSLVTVTCECSF